MTALTPQQQLLQNILAGTATPATAPRRAARTGNPRAPPASAGRSRTGRTAAGVPITDQTAVQLAQFATQGRQPTANAPPAQRKEGVRGRKVGGGVVGTAISPVGEEAIRAFVNANGNCPGFNEDQLRQFLDTVQRNGFNDRDLNAILRDISIATGGKKPDLQKNSRWGGGVFAAQVLGVRGTRAEIPLPSTTWFIAQTYCGNLPAITAAIQGVADGTFGHGEPVPLPSANTLVDPQRLQQITRDVRVFDQAYPACAASADDQREFLALIDAAHANGRDIYALARVLGLEGYIASLFTGYDLRYAGGTVTPFTTGVTPETFNQIKQSLLWGVMREYCNQLREVNQFIAQIYSGNALAGLPAPGTAYNVAPLGAPKSAPNTFGR